MKEDVEYRRECGLIVTAMEELCEKWFDKASNSLIGKDSSDSKGEIATKLQPCSLVWYLL